MAMFSTIHSKSFLRPMTKASNPPVKASPASTRIAARTSTTTKKTAAASGSAFANAFAAATLPASASGKTTQAANISSRQNVATVRKSSSIVSVQDDAVTTPPAQAKTAQEILSGALTNLGYDPLNFKMESHEDFVPYPQPGGGYLYRYTTVQMPNGRQENFSTDLLMKYPDITANEIKRIMGMPPGADPNSGLF